MRGCFFSTSCTFMLQWSLRAWTQSTTNCRRDSNLTFFALASDLQEWIAALSRPAFAQGSDPFLQVGG